MIWEHQICLLGIFESEHMGFFILVDDASVFGLFFPLGTLRELKKSRQHTLHMPIGKVFITHWKQILTTTEVVAQYATSSAFF